VKARAQAGGIETARPFPFLLAGTPVEVRWHVNVDRTGGQPITPELFTQSKAGYVSRGVEMDIVGFQSESHPGIFISQFAPGIKPGDVLKNAIHIHMVTRDGQAAGHIDDIILGPGMTLKLPAI
jgi:acetolactate decarboxylase